MTVIVAEPEFDDALQSWAETCHEMVSGEEGVVEYETVPADVVDLTLFPLTNRFAHGNCPPAFESDKESENEIV